MIGIYCYCGKKKDIGVNAELYISLTLRRLSVSLKTARLLKHLKYSATS